MSQEKYIGMDVHQATISVAVRDSRGNLIMECILETKAATILEFIEGVRGTLAVTFEEGTCAAWLHDLLKPHVSRLLVCDPRKNALLKDGSKSDRIDARKLAELLRGGQLSPVYHGDHGVRTLKELGRSYLTITKDLTRVMSAGGVADERVTQMLRQGDAQVFKKYSQMKLQMKREALEKLNRRASEMAPTTGERMRTVVVQ
jgi:hypothetical protein